MCNLGKLVNESDVYLPKGIVKYLGSLGYLRRRDFNDGIAKRRIKLFSFRTGFRCKTTY